MVFSVLVLSYGALLEYTIIIKDTVPTILGYGVDDDDGNSSDMERNIILLFIWAFIIVPLTMLKNVSSLAFTSALSLVAALLSVVVVAVQSPIQESIASNGGLWQVAKQYWVGPNIFAAVNIFNEAMSWQHGALILLSSLRGANRRRWLNVTSIVHVTACCLHASIGLSGFLAFLDDTEGDILNNLDADSIVTNVARGCFALIMILTYPVEAFIAREAVEAFIRCGCDGGLIDESDESDTDYTGDQEGDDAEKNGNFLAAHLLSGKGMRVVWAVNIMVLLPGLILDDLGIVLATVGALGGNLVCFVAPGLIYLGVHGNDFIMYTNALLGCRVPAVTNTGDMVLAIESNKNNKLIRDGDLPGLITEATSHEYKPFWWYLFGFPVWRYVARYGASHMTEKLTEYENSSQSPIAKCLDMLNSTASLELYEEDEVSIVPASPNDFFIAIFLIVFGCTNLVAGLVMLRNLE